MKNSYKELIDQTYYFPQEGFDLHDGTLHFNGIDLKKIIDTYGRLQYAENVNTETSEIIIFPKLTLTSQRCGIMIKTRI